MKTVKNFKTPICPNLLFFTGDEYRCNTNLCDYDTYNKICTMMCLNKYVVDNNTIYTETTQYIQK